MIGLRQKIDQFFNNRDASQQLSLRLPGADVHGGTENMGKFRHSQYAKRSLAPYLERKAPYHSAVTANDDFIKLFARSCS